MFGPPGHAYVYLIYGMHYCVNAVCLPAGTAEAVLVRAVEPSVGAEILKRHRPSVRPLDITNGPGKLCEAMDINRSLDGIDLCDPKAPLFIAENPRVGQLRRELGPLVTTTRIGITKAAALPLRFYLGGSRYVSQRDR